MLKNKYKLLILLVFIPLFLTSCIGLLSSDEDIVDDSSIQDMDITFQEQTTRIFVDTIPNATSYKLEVNGIELEDIEIMDSCIADYYYDFTDEPFIIHVYAYNKKDKLIGEGEEVFYPLVINNFKFDKDTGFATFDKIEAADGYIVSRIGYEDIIVTEEKIDLNVYLNATQLGYVTITPFSNKENHFGVEFDKMFTDPKDVEGFRYDGIDESFYWYTGLNTTDLYELTINDEIHYIKGSRYFKYKITEPTTATLRNLGSSDFTFNSKPKTISIENPQAEIKSINYNPELKRISWDRIADNYKYYITLLANDKEYTYETKYTYINVSDLRLNDFEIKIRGILEDKTNTIFKTYSFSYNIYDKVNITGHYNYDENINTIYIESPEKDILGYNIKIIKNDIEVFNKEYRDGSYIKFIDYQFLDDGEYTLKCNPIYQKTDSFILEDKTDYTYTIYRASTPQDISFDDGLITVNDAASICYVEDEERIFLDSTSFTYKNNNTTFNDIKKTLDIYASYSLIPKSKTIVLPSFNPYKLELTLLAPIKAIEASNNQINWTYEGEKDSFIVEYANNQYEVNTNTYTPVIKSMYNSIYVMPKQNNEAFEISAASRVIYITKLQAPKLLDAIIEEDTLTIELEKLDKALKYEFMINDNSYILDSNAYSFKYNDNDIIKFKAYGEGKVFDSDISSELKVLIVKPQGEIINSNANQSITINGINNLANEFEITRTITMDNNEYIKDNLADDAIDVSDFDPGRYHLDISVASKLEGNIIYVGNSILQYDFTVLKYEMTPEQFGFKANYYPSDIVNDNIYNYINLKVSTGYSSGKLDYHEEFKDLASPKIAGLYDDNASVSFSFRDNTDGYRYDDYNVFVKNLKQTFLRYVKKTSNKGSVTYYWDNIHEVLTLSIYDVYNPSTLYYTVLRDGKEYKTECSKSIQVEAPYYSTEYAIRIKNQIRYDYFYTGYDFETYKYSNYEYDEPINLKALNRVEKVTYDIGWNYTGAKYYTILLENIDVDQPNKLDKYYLYVRLYKEEYDSTTNKYGEKTFIVTENALCYGYLTTFEIDYIHLKDKTRLTFEFYIYSSPNLSSGVYQSTYVAE